jgi:hypothetical protein
MGDQYGRSDINEISIAISIWNMGYQFGIWNIDMEYLVTVFKLPAS